MRKYNVGDRFIKVRHHGDDTDESTAEEGGVPIGFITEILAITNMNMFKLKHPGSGGWISGPSTLEEAYGKVGTNKQIDWKKVMTNGN